MRRGSTPVRPLSTRPSKSHGLNVGNAAHSRKTIEGHHRSAKFGKQKHKTPSDASRAFCAGNVASLPTFTTIPSPLIRLKLNDAPTIDHSLHFARCFLLRLNRALLSLS